MVCPFSYDIHWIQWSLRAETLEVFLFALKIARVEKVHALRHNENEELPDLR